SPQQEHLPPGERRAAGERRVGIPGDDLAVRRLGGVRVVALVRELPEGATVGLTLEDLPPGGRLERDHDALVHGREARQRVVAGERELHDRRRLAMVRGRGTGERERARERGEDGRRRTGERHDFPPATLRSGPRAVKLLRDWAHTGVPVWRARTLMRRCTVRASRLAALTGSGTRGTRAVRCRRQPTASTSSTR